MKREDNRHAAYQWATQLLFSITLCLAVGLSLNLLSTSVSAGEDHSERCYKDKDCDDGNVCTTNVCRGGKCKTTYNNNSCDDGIFCNGEDFCKEGKCIHKGDPCKYGKECQNVCNEMDKNCYTPEGTECKSDGNPCTDNECNGKGKCVAINNMDSCETDDKCTVGMCMDGECVEEPINCDDGIQCTMDYCDENTGQCVNDTSSCECNTDADCNDNNPCTRNTCSSSLTCVTEVLEGASCDDGDNCTVGDACNANGSCVGQPVDCGEDPCIVCDPSTGACVEDTTSEECADFQEIIEGNDLQGSGGCSLNTNKSWAIGSAGAVLTLLLMALPYLGLKRRKQGKE